jgi:hypothetical protein
MHNNLNLYIIIIINLIYYLKEKIASCKNLIFANKIDKILNKYNLVIICIKMNNH